MYMVLENSKTHAQVHMLLYVSDVFLCVYVFLFFFMFFFFVFFFYARLSTNQRLSADADNNRIHTKTRSFFL